MYQPEGNSPTRSCSKSPLINPTFWIGARLDTNAVSAGNRSGNRVLIRVSSRSPIRLRDRAALPGFLGARRKSRRAVCFGSFRARAREDAAVRQRGCSPPRSPARSESAPADVGAIDQDRAAPFGEVGVAGVRGAPRDEER